jgi:hypothetical protein
MAGWKWTIFCARFADHAARSFPKRGVSPRSVPISLVPPSFQRRRIIRLAQRQEGKADLSAIASAKEDPSGLRPACPSQHGIHRHHHQGVEGNQGRPLLGCQSFFPLSRGGNIRLCHHSLSAASMGGNARMLPNVES